jgi:hypothetical protein
MKENDERWVLGGLSIISLYILQVVISLNTHDIPAFISLVCLSVAIPLLAGSTVFLFYRSTGILVKYVSSRIFRISFVTVTTLGVIIDLAGIDAAIWHASAIAGWVFLGSVIFGFAFFGSALVWLINNAEQPLEAFQKAAEMLSQIKEISDELHKEAEAQTNAFVTQANKAKEDMAKLLEDVPTKGEK